MSASKESNSSKTAHVMNLLSRTRANPAAEAAAQEKSRPTGGGCRSADTDSGCRSADTGSGAPARARAGRERSPVHAAHLADHRLSQQRPRHFLPDQGPLWRPLWRSLAESEPVAETPPAPVVEEVPPAKASGGNAPRTRGRGSPPAKASGGNAPRTRGRGSPPTQVRGGRTRRTGY